MNQYSYCYIAVVWSQALLQSQQIAIATLQYGLRSGNLMHASCRPVMHIYSQLQWIAKERQPDHLAWKPNWTPDNYQLKYSYSYSYYHKAVISFVTACIQLQLQSIAIYPAYIGIHVYVCQKSPIAIATQHIATPLTSQSSTLSYSYICSQLSMLILCNCLHALIVCMALHAVAIY